MSHTMQIWERVFGARVRSEVMLSEQRCDFMLKKSYRWPVALTSQVMHQYPGKTPPAPALTHQTTSGSPSVCIPAPTLR